MYDYNNARFLSVDPFIQSPTSTQSMNPYSYLGNNPLSGTDPTGYAKQDATSTAVLEPVAGFVTGSHIKTTVGVKATITSSTGAVTVATSFGSGAAAFFNGGDSSGVKGANTNASSNLSDTGKPTAMLNRVGNSNNNSNTGSNNTSTTSNAAVVNNFNKKKFDKRFSNFIFATDVDVTMQNDFAEMIDVLDTNNEPILDEVNSLAKKENTNIIITSRNIGNVPSTKQTSMAIMILPDKRVVLSINTRSGLKLKGGMQSPVVGLLHEGNHLKTILTNFSTNINLLISNKERKKRKFKRNDDRNIIRGPETDFARKLNQPVRKKHSSGIPTDVNCSTCTQ